MKKIFTFLLISIFIQSLSAQSDKVSLKEYCPTSQGQEGAICFAYATTYTALSIEHNVKNNNKNEKSADFKSFSYGFVASKVKKNKPFFGRLFNRCGRNATAKLALEVLEENGTVIYEDFKEKCDCGKTDKVLEQAKEYKIKKFNTIGDTKSQDKEHIQKIKQNLLNNKPVITTILQESFFYDSNGKDDILFPENYIKKNNFANHVVCIVGYDDKHNGGSFIVKNNYKQWGINGFSHVKYDDFINLIRTSYTIEI